MLQKISKETGGGYFEVSKKKSLDDIYAQLQEELRSQYNLGYTSSNKPASSPEFRKIHLTVADKSIVVRTRDGYYTKAEPRR